MREHLEQIGRDNRVKKREHGEQTEQGEQEEHIGKYYIWFLLRFRDCLHRSLPYFARTNFNLLVIVLYSA